MKTINKVIRFDKFSKCEYSYYKSPLNGYHFDFVILFDPNTSYSSSVFLKNVLEFVPFIRRVFRKVEDAYLCI